MSLRKSIFNNSIKNSVNKFYIFEYLFQYTSTKKKCIKYVLLTQQTLKKG